MHNWHMECINGEGMCDPRDKHLERGAGYMTCRQHIMIGAEPFNGLLCPPDSFQYTLNLLQLYFNLIFH